MRKADVADTIVLPNENVEAAVAALGVVRQEPEFADLPPRLGSALYWA